MLPKPPIPSEYWFCMVIIGELMILWCWALKAGLWSKLLFEPPPNMLADDAFCSEGRY